MACSTSCGSSVIFWIIVVIIFAILIFFFTKPKREGYKDPIFMNAQKFIHDYYPKSNGSIYGLPYIYDQEKNLVIPGGFDMYRGYVFYPKIN